MPRDNQIVNVALPDTFWRPDGERNAETGAYATTRLLGTLVLGGTYFHVHAIQVESDPVACTQIAVDQQYQPDLDDLATVVTPDGNWETMMIGGAEYVVYMSPFCS